MRYPVTRLDLCLRGYHRVGGGQSVFGRRDYDIRLLDLVTDRERLRELAAVWRGAGHVAGSAATIVVLGPAADNEFHRAQFDLGQATMAMTLAATDLGIGSRHAGVADLELARDLLGFPSDRNWAFLISLGYPADRPLTPVKTPERRPFSEVVHRGHW